MDLVEQFSPSVGDRLGELKLTKLLRKDRLRHVFMAERGDDKLVVKVVLPHKHERLTDPDRGMPSFEADAQRIEQLQHPNTMPLVGYGRTKQNLPYLTNNLVRGRSLNKVLAAHPLTLPQTVDLAKQVLGSLAEAHALGIVHRDLRPRNVLLTSIGSGKQHVLVRNYAESFLRSSSGVRVSSPRYMAPEQARGQVELQQQDGRIDVYALGLLMAECLTGARVLQGNKKKQLIDEQGSARPVNFSLQVRESPVFFLIQRATAKDPHDRFDDAWSMHKSLADFERTELGLISPNRLPKTVIGETPRRPHPSSAPRAPVPSKSYNQVYWFMALLVMLALGFYVVWVNRIPAEHTPENLGSGAALEVQAPGHSTQEASADRLDPEDDADLGAATSANAADLTRGAMGAEGNGASSERSGVPGEDSGVSVEGSGVGSGVTDLEGSGQTADHTPMGSGAALDTIAFVPAALPSCSTDDDCVEGHCSQTACAPEGFAYIPAGEYLIGSPDDESRRDADNETQHSVYLDYSFLVAQTEVTQMEWIQQVESNPARYFRRGEHHPVERVSWFEALAYCNARSEAEGLEPCYELIGCSGTAGTSDYVCESATWVAQDCSGYRLPTEAEWEVAARGGNLAATFIGQPRGSRLERFHEAVNYEDNGDQRPVDAGSMRANDYGLTEVLGNVREWCWDWYAADYGGVSSLGVSVEDPRGPETGAERVVRGGSFSSPLRDVRSAARRGRAPDVRATNTGFRIVRTVD